MPPIAKPGSASTNALSPPNESSAKRPEERQTRMPGMQGSGRPSDLLGRSFSAPAPSDYCE